MDLKSGLSASSLPLQSVPFPFLSFCPCSQFGFYPHLFLFRVGFCPAKELCPVTFGSSQSPDLISPFRLFLWTCTHQLGECPRAGIFICVLSGPATLGSSCEGPLFVLGVLRSQMPPCLPLFSSQGAGAMRVQGLLVICSSLLLCGAWWTKPCHPVRLLFWFPHRTVGFEG